MDLSQLTVEQLPLSTTMGSEKYPHTRHLKIASLISGIIELQRIIIPLRDTIFSISNQITPVIHQNLDLQIYIIFH